MMGQMVATISHEITQPLSAISNFAAASSLLLGNEDVDSTVQHHIAAILQQSERAGNIISRIRDFARRTEPHRSTRDLRILINDALELSRADLRRRGVTIKFTSPEPTLLVLADHVQIQQVLLNLISNACDAMQELPAGDRRIWIRCWRDTWPNVADSFVSFATTTDESEDTENRAMMVVVEVADNGPGLDPNGVAHLFDPFFTSKPQGMGLGLSICRDIVKSHQGMISDSLTVYLVDDDQAVLDSLTGLLVAAQHTTRKFVSAESFLHSIDDGVAGCVVTDLKMTGMSGLDLLRELKAGGCLLPIIVVTGHATVPVAVELMQSGAITLLQKPYKPHELLHAVDRALDLYKQLRRQRNETAAIQARLETLSADEYRVMQLMADGLPNREIAEDLETSLRTVDRRRSSVLDKMQAPSATDLARMLTLLHERSQES